MLCKHRHSNAFTMVEVLISLAIMGILLAALGTAFNASAINYRENREISMTMNSARQAMDRMVMLIRTGQPDPADTAAATCTLVAADGTDMTFSYNAGQKKLYCITGGQNRLLCENVTAMTFAKTTGKDSLNADCVKSVVIAMTVKAGDVSQTVSGAAVVRPNL
jgi:prepilin-type N-terminal cleavage/methylation domain-containing protein